MNSIQGFPHRDSHVRINRSIVSVSNEQLDADVIFNAPFASFVLTKPEFKKEIRPRKSS